ncbi:hypothetical protein G9A89_009171 [Geosiphon pyriformis]|nr:hypothetical protein G9A89_009171 [Geosiphon pyriformis]
MSKNEATSVSPTVSLNTSTEGEKDQKRSPAQNVNNSSIDNENIARSIGGPFLRGTRGGRSRGRGTARGRGGFRNNNRQENGETGYSWSVREGFYQNISENRASSGIESSSSHNISNERTFREYIPRTGGNSSYKQFRNHQDRNRNPTSAETTPQQGIQETASNIGETNINPKNGRRSGSRYKRGSGNANQNLESRTRQRNYSENIQSNISQPPGPLQPNSQAVEQIEHNSVGSTNSGPNLNRTTWRPRVQHRHNRTQSANPELTVTPVDSKGKTKENDFPSSENSGYKESRAKSADFRPRSKRASILRMSQSEITDVLTSITHGLSTSTYECMICCETVRPSNRTWSCTVCWAVFHLHCTEKWANKSITEAIKTDGAWRCPGCQHKSTSIPQEYWCFCGKVLNPENNRYFTPHTCGQICGRSRDCPHDCTLQCHPGPCPPCAAMGPLKSCWCGKQSIQKRCADTDYAGGMSCEETCGKLLNCGLHYCEKACHGGPCSSCKHLEIKGCYCGKSKREETCGSGQPVRSFSQREGDPQEWTGYFACEQNCDRLLECDKHRCQKICHPVTVELEPCPYDPSRIKTCPCGAKSILSILGRERSSCTEEIPNCHNKCNKLLKCGHNCKMACHSGECSLCQLKMRVPCRCGSTEFERKCSELEGEPDELPICDKICQGLRTCGKHQCNARCCPSANKPRPSKKLAFGREPEEDENHRCTFVCGKKLQCGNHNCQMPCHRGHCLQCLEASFDELTCHCGRTKVYPPIPCGMKVPPCPYTCTRAPLCGHIGVSHPCHDDSQACPPCPYLVEKMCMCGKSSIRSVTCYKTNVSCGTVCDRIVPCGGHRCKRTCHSGDCLANEQGLPGKCTQACGKPRQACGHPCTAPCHAPARCPDDKPCQTKVILLCKCGNLKQEVTCFMSSQNVTEGKNRQLQCTDYCAVLERNKKLAQALEIEDRAADGSTTKPALKYSDEFVKYYNANKEWARNIETILNDFMKSEKQALDLKPMKSTHRKFIHELCTHYKLASESVDIEPHRSVYIKKKPESTPPLIPLSQALSNQLTSSGVVAVNPPIPISSSSSSPLEQLPRKPKQPVNGLYLAELTFGITHEELQRELEPILGRFKYVVKWVAEDDAVVLPIAGSMQMDELETLLMRLKTTVKEALVPKATVAWVELCWVNAKYEVVWRERGKLISSLGTVSSLGSGSDIEAKSGSVVLSHGTSTRNSNTFKVLSDMATRETPKRATSKQFIWTSPSVAFQKSKPDKDVAAAATTRQSNLGPFLPGSEEDVPDDWEMLSDGSDSLMP